MCLVVQIYRNFIYETEFRVYLGSERVTMAYNATFAKGWNTTAADEDVHASNPTQEEEEDVVFDQDRASDTQEYLDLI